MVIFLRYVGCRLEDKLKERVCDSSAQVMYWYGEKEMKCVKKSALLFQTLFPICEIYEAKGYDHGYLSLYLPDEWLQMAVPFFDKVSYNYHVKEGV